MTKRLPEGRRKRPWGTERGAAILVVLAVLAILSILVLGFVSSMNTDLKSSRSIEVSYQTKLIAHGALSHSIELLRSNIPDPAPITETPESAPARLWVTNPGRLTIINSGGSYSTIPLHSGAAPDPDEDAFFEARSVDLNRPLAGKTIGPIASLPEESFADERPVMRVAWHPVMADPSKPPGPDNQMTGRYAFWIDDESSKLNTSVALGKPNLDEKENSPGGFENWKSEFVDGAVTPHFQITGEGNKKNKGVGPRVSLGHPWSINIDTLFEDGELPIDLVRLHHESHVHGFQRYPDAILRFVDLPEKEKRKWYRENRWNMTFYSRAPEFNAFGLSRLFMLHAPVTLPGGPAYQMPFSLPGRPAHQMPTSQNGHTHFQALFGFPSSVGLLSDDPELQLQIHELTLDSGQMLMQYLKRQWPGQPGSLFSKYGGKESRQIVLNALMMSRFATARVFQSDGYARLVTSMNYAGDPDNEEIGIPERSYWHLDDNFEVDSVEPPMLPQTPGPHINEIKFTVEPEEDFVGGNRVSYIRYQYEVELYLHPEHPMGPYFPPEANPKLVKPSDDSPKRFPFPIKVDYLKLDASGDDDDDDDGGSGGASDSSDRIQEFDDPDWNSKHLKKLRPDPTLPTVIGSETLNYQVVQSPVFYMGRGEAPVGKGEPKERRLTLDPDFDSPVTFKVNLRLGLGVSKVPEAVKDMIPLAFKIADTDGDTDDDDDSGDPYETLVAEFSLDLTDPDPKQFVSWEVVDPRVSWHKELWELPENDHLMGHTMGAPNSNQPQEPDADEYSTFKYVQLPGFLRGNGGPDSTEDEFESDTRFPSAGYLSMIHTGIQSKEPWRTLSLQEPDDDDAADGKTLSLQESDDDDAADGRTLRSQEPDDCHAADWVLLDLLGPSFLADPGKGVYSRSLPDQWMSLSYMNATGGKVNLNNKVYPDSEWFDPPDRTKPLKAVFRYLRDDDSIDILTQQILNYQSKNRVFESIGDLTKIRAYPQGETNWEKESLLRNLASCLTTQSNTFGVWGCAQTVIKAPGSERFDELEKNDSVLGEKRFFALVERYVWPGRDGIPGNGHVDSSAMWDRLAWPLSDLTDSVELPGSTPLLGADGKFDVMDGPNTVTLDHPELMAEVPFKSSSLAAADNPPHPVVKYRVLYFRYLDH